MSEGDEFIEVGRVSGLFGVKGWVRLFSYTEPRENILDYSPLYLRIEGEWRPYEIAEGQAHGKGVVARLDRVTDRDMAATLLGAPIAVHRDQLPELEGDEFYWADLAGLRVVTLAGVELGVVDHLFETGANDVLVVLGERERLIPYTEDVVREIDLERGVIEVDWDPEF